MKCLSCSPPNNHLTEQFHKEIVRLGNLVRFILFSPLCVCVCLFVCMCVYVCVHVCVCAHTRACVCGCVFGRVLVHFPVSRVWKRRGMQSCKSSGRYHTFYLVYCSYSAPNSIVLLLLLYLELIEQNLANYSMHFLLSSKLGKHLFKG